MRYLRDNGLTLVLILLFLFSIAGMGWAGWRANNDDLAEHGRPAIGLITYLGSGDFASALYENWESEFLQMSAYVMLTAFLYQRGSAESRDPDAAGQPKPVPTKHGRLLGFLRAYSLGLAL